MGSETTRPVRALCVVLVVGPIIALGFFLGTGGIRLQSPGPEESPGHVVAAPDVQIRLAEGGVRIRSEQVGETLNDVDQLYLSGVDKSGRKRTEARMEVTDLPPVEAAAHYDRKARELGWTFSKALTDTMAVPDTGTAVRAYRKPGRLRVVMIGPPLREGNATRPVTLFESALDGPPETEEN